MPRVRITSSWPIASTAIAAVWESTLPALPVVRKTGESKRHRDDQTERGSGPDRAGSRRGRAAKSRIAPRRMLIGLERPEIDLLGRRLPHRSEAAASAVIAARGRAFRDSPRSSSTPCRCDQLPRATIGVRYATDIGCLDELSCSSRRGGEIGMAAPLTEAAIEQVRDLIATASSPRSTSPTRGRARRTSLGTSRKHGPGSRPSPGHRTGPGRSARRRHLRHEPATRALARGHRRRGRPPAGRFHARAG